MVSIITSAVCPCGEDYRHKELEKSNAVGRRTSPWLFCINGPGRTLLLGLFSWKIKMFSKAYNHNALNSARIEQPIAQF